MPGAGIRPGTTTGNAGMIAQPAEPVPAPRGLTAYRLRWKRRRLLLRSWRSRRQLCAVADRTATIGPEQIIAIMTVRNEIARLPFFLAHHRRIGVGHFLVVDNASTDGTAEYLAQQADISVWHTGHDYRDARFGLDWMTWLQMTYGHRRWTLMLDADELLVYAHHETRSLRDLTGWLERTGRTVFGAHMLDLYPRGPLGEGVCTPGSDPAEWLGWFDAGPYRARRQVPIGNLWVQGGARERVFFADQPRRSPTLNKIPLVRWSRRYAYVNSCHSALPAHLNAGYDGPGGQAPSGVLLHSKFLPEIVDKSVEEKARGQHFHTPSEFAGYYDRIASRPTLWTPGSVRYEDWRQLERLGLMSSGGW